MSNWREHWEQRARSERDKHNEVEREFAERLAGLEGRREKLERWRRNREAVLKTAASAADAHEAARAEFEAGYAERSHLTLEQFYDFGLRGEVCECGELKCEGWKVVNAETGEEIDDPEKDGYRYNGEAAG